MRKFLAIAAMSLVMAGSAAAQGGGGGGGGMANMTPEQRQQMQYDRLFKDITVTDAVKTKAMEIIKKHSEEIAKIPQDAADRREQTTAHRTAQNNELKALLTNDADKTTFDKNAVPAGRRGGGPPPVR